MICFEITPQAFKTMSQIIAFDGTLTFPCSEYVISLVSTNAVLGSDIIRGRTFYQAFNIFCHKSRVRILVDIVVVGYPDIIRDFTV